MARHIKNLNPSAIVQVADIDVALNTEPWVELVKEWRPDLIVECTDNDLAKHAVNEVAVQFRIPTVGAGVLDGGIGGEIYRTRPGEACYSCLVAQFPRRGQVAQKRGKIDYNDLDVEEFRSTPALNIDIALIAFIHARIALGLLSETVAKASGVPDEANIWVFANCAAEGIFPRPLHCEFYRIPRLPDCLVCGRQPEHTIQEARQILGELDIGSRTSR